MNCPHCGSEHTNSRGIRNNKNRFECQERDCGAWFTTDVPDEKLHKNDEAPTIVVFDIETMVKKAFLFRAGKQYVNADNFTDENKMICWSAKVLGDSKSYHDCMTPEEAINKDHSRIVKSLWDVLSQADFTISHNGINFDLPMVNTFFLKDKLGLPGKFRNIDTCAIARRTFKFESNRLDYIVRYLGLNSGKSDTDFQLWIDCYNGDKKALKKMQDYNINDIVILEDLYNAMVPYIPNFYNMGVWGDVDERVCPYCRSTNFKENGYVYSPNGKFHSYRCECKAIFRSKLNLLSKEKKTAQFMF